MRGTLLFLLILTVIHLVLGKRARTAANVTIVAKLDDQNPNAPSEYAALYQLKHLGQVKHLSGNYHTFVTTGGALLSQWRKRDIYGAAKWAEVQVPRQQYKRYGMPRTGRSIAR